MLGTVADDAWRAQLEALGAYIRHQRTMHRLSLRELAELAHVSNPYLSQIERGLHEPSVRVLHSIAGALNLSAETLLAHAGLLSDETNESTASGDGRRDGRSAVEVAIDADDRLTDDQRQALLTVYRGFVGT